MRPSRGNRVVVSVVIDAPVERVWSEVEHVERHVDWMADAVAITFTSAQHEGVGTTFDCATKIGPIRLTDRMEITEWVTGRRMGVRHRGLVTGEGRFELTPVAGGTEFTWDETLRFPWWMGGSIGGRIGAVILRRVWKRNLAALRHRIEAPST